MALLPPLRDRRAAIVNWRPGAAGSVSAALIAAALTVATAQDEPSAALQVAGDRIYHGVGTCHFCHGDDGRGLPRLGSNLTDGEWTFADGSIRSIEALIESGLSAERSTHGMPMPPRAGAPLTAQQVRAVSAYVWSLSRPSS